MANCQECGAVTDHHTCLQSVCQEASVARNRHRAWFKKHPQYDVVITVNDDYMVLWCGWQLGGKVNETGAGDKAYQRAEDAWQAAKSHQRARQRNIASL